MALPSSSGKISIVSQVRVEYNHYRPGENACVLLSLSRQGQHTCTIRVNETLAVVAAGVSSCSIPDVFALVNKKHYRFVINIIDKKDTLCYSFLEKVRSSIAVYSQQFYSQR